MKSDKRTGQTMHFRHPVFFLGSGCCGGTMEGQGPLKSYFDYLDGDNRFGQETFEQAEQQSQKLALDTALTKAGLSMNRLDLLLAGDLLNQCAPSAYHARDCAVPYLGLYNACSTMGEGLSVGSMLLDGGFARHVGVVVSSHYCTAERQYRTPLEYGGQRTPTAQWTVTGSGAAVLGLTGSGPCITHCTVGKVTDLGVTDTNNMGAAMAPVDVKLAPYPEETRQYKIQLFSTKYDCFHGGDMVFRTKKKYLQWHQKSRQASVAVCRLLQYKVLFTRLYIGTVSDFGFSPIGKIPFIFGLLLLIFC